ncbi:potassium transporter Kup [Gulosibacter macacae]|uniref:Probable potassium transport system protein Kup n=1 Tax=Gulosibacter macacae TaxID=2488791 RepID=A0A3P3VUE7_9MICO|nr:KUP/HAK/KT family potassium transporter [Gulosibacter macacae]RRJ86435.1 potassium transporter Kup [Gulosibacter macacae]
MGPIPALVLGAIGVVFGDIGTSPLYSLQTVFSIEHNTVDPSRQDVLGVISMVFWCLVIIVTVTYAGIIMRADNDGEGGILALAALLVRKLKGRPTQTKVAVLLAVLGAALFYGDSLITPAISVLSAVEGLQIAAPALDHYVVPIAVVILSALFAVQRWGTGLIGKAFGPVMACWFVVIAALGLPHLIANPEILIALSPSYAFDFVLSRPFVAFIAMGAVVLAVTGVEALYADMGHFGRKPIVIAWGALVFPALVLNYLGQGAMILDEPRTTDSPFFHLAPAWAQLPLVVLATMATVIASQAVISGAFSVSRQATRLELLPRLKVIQTSKHHGGQIFVPVINGVLFVGVLVLVLSFRSSEALASAYGLSVTGTLLLELSLVLLIAHAVWGWRLWQVLLLAVVVGGLELILFAANVTKIASGGWLPLAVAAVAVTMMLTWQRGSRIAFGNRTQLEGSLEAWVRDIRLAGVQRVPGTVVCPHAHPETVPLALRSNVDFNHVIHERVVIVSMRDVGVPHVPLAERIEVSALGDTSDGIVRVICRVGFNDPRDVPAALKLAIGKSPELDFDPDAAVYMLSVFRIELGHERTMPIWQKRLFVVLEKLSANRTQSLHLPPDRTVIVGAESVL